jgi:hypothetical protein
MQCGCECIRCSIDGTTTTDSATCNDRTISGVACLETDPNNCGPAFTDATRIRHCAIANPSKWPPLYKLTGALDPVPILSDSGGDYSDYMGDYSSGKDNAEPSHDGSPGTSSSDTAGSGGGGHGGDASATGRRLAAAAEAPAGATADGSKLTFLYTSTGSNVFVEQMMARLFRQPNITVSLSPGNATTLAVRHLLLAETPPLYCSAGTRTPDPTRRRKSSARLTLWRLCQELDALAKPFSSIDLQTLSTLPWDLGAYESGLDRLYLDQVLCSAQHYPPQHCLAQHCLAQSAQPRPCLA